MILDLKENIKESIQFWPEGKIEIVNSSLALVLRSQCKAWGQPCQEQRLTIVVDKTPRKRTTVAGGLPGKFGRRVTSNVPLMEALVTTTTRSETWRGLSQCWNATSTVLETRLLSWAVPRERSRRPWRSLCVCHRNSRQQGERNRPLSRVTVRHRMRFRQRACSSIRSTHVTTCSSPTR